MTVQKAVETCAQELADLGVQVEPHDNEVAIRCEPAQVAEVLRRLRDGALACQYFGFMTAIDYPPGWEEGKRRGRASEKSEGAEEGGEAPETAGERAAAAPAAGFMDLVYQVASPSQETKVFVYAWVDRADPRAPSAVGVYPGADWHERECYDLFGVVFEGHPDLRRILLPDEWVGYPLRKDYDPAVNDLLYVPEKRWPEVAEERKV